jgi:hypothetical protein
VASIGIGLASCIGLKRTDCAIAILRHVRTINLSESSIDQDEIIRTHVCLWEVRGAKFIIEFTRRPTLSTDLRVSTPDGLATAVCFTPSEGCRTTISKFGHVIASPWRGDADNCVAIRPALLTTLLQHVAWEVALMEAFYKGSFESCVKGENARIYSGRGRSRA